MSVDDNNITVFLRIVGAYFGSVPQVPPDENVTGDVAVKVSPNPTVKDLLDEAKRRVEGNSEKEYESRHEEQFPDIVSGFRFQSMPMGDVSGDASDSGDDQAPPEILHSVEIDYEEPPNKEETYPPGTYRLRQQLCETPAQVFQYYIYSVIEDTEDNSVELRRKNTDNEFVPFNQEPKPADRIEDGDYVTWRLVTIRTSPVIEKDPPYSPFGLERRMMGDDRNFG